MPRIRKPLDTDTAILDEQVLDEQVLDEDVLDEPAIVPVAAPIRTAAPPPPTPPPGPVPESVTRHVADVRTGDQLLVRQHDGQRLAPDDEAFLAWLWPTEADRFRQMSRVARRRKFQRQAGTAEQRDAAKAKAEETAAQLATEGQRLRAIIAEAQSTLDGLQRDADQARAVVEGHDVALAGLSDPALLNDCDRAMYQRRRTDWERDYGRPSRELRQQAQGLRATAALDPAKFPRWTEGQPTAERADSEKIIEYCQASKNPAVRAIAQVQFLHRTPQERAEGIRDQRHPKIDVAAWQAHAAELLQRADAAEAEASRLEEAGQGLRQELAAMLAALVPS